MKNKMITLEEIKKIKLSIANAYNIPIDYHELDRTCYDEYCKLHGIEPEKSEYIPLKYKETIFSDKVLNLQ